MKNIIIGLSFIIAIIALIVAYKHDTPNAQQTQPAMARVLASNIIRCGYYVFPPATYRDANTNALSGFSVDLMERIAANGGLKVEWAEEVTFGNWPAALQAGRVDAICTPLWPDAALARGTYFTKPHIYAAINAYVRADEKRFTDIKQLNDSAVTVIDVDGAGYKDVIQRYFPKVKIITVPQAANGGEMAINVIDGKADFILWDENGVTQFSKNNPGKLKPVNLAQPLRVMPFVYGVGRGETDLQNLLDVGTDVMLDNGTVDELLAKWQMIPAFLRVPPNYKLPGQ